MKLKNKKTGEIGELQITEKHCAVAVGNGTVSCGIEIYSSLAELNAEWEDYEEPKEYWTIDGHGKVHEIFVHSKFIDEEKEIGNYFDTGEEAEKAVEKLKAWSRLKDKGFRFTGINDDEDSQELITQCGILCEADIYHLAKDEDFLLLFGGEE